MSGSSTSVPKIHLLVNGQIHTMSHGQPQGTAMALTGPRDDATLDGRILAIGSDDQILDDYGERAASKRNLDGQVIIPGLTDSHIHLEQYAFSLTKVDCETPTMEECLKRVESRARQTPPGQWILGHGWAQAEWPGGFGTVDDLDQITPEHPVYLTAKSLHAGWANSNALSQAGITGGTPDPDGGRIDRTPDGLPTGILFENAMELVSHVIPRASVSDTVRVIADALPRLWKLGLTGVHDFDRQRCFSALQELHREGGLRLRVVKSVPLEELDHAVSLGLRTGFGDDMLRIGSVKAFSDGALGPRTAAMLEPFNDDPDNSGILLLDREDLYEIGQKATVHGLSVAVHAIGDRANHEVIAAYEQVRSFEKEAGLRSLRHRIEHVQLIHPEDVGRLARTGVIASMQPTHAPSDMIAAENSWGERSASAYAWKTLADAGIYLTFGSDAPVESPNPFWGLHAAVTRRRHDGSPGPAGWRSEQRIELAAAIHAFTTAPAFTAGVEDRLGMLARGYLADFLVLPRDFFTMDASQIWKTDPLATVIGGQWVYSMLD